MHHVAYGKTYLTRMIKLSLIIPAYNVEQYIVDTLRSITQQITNDVEVIVVNDGSTDNTATQIVANFDHYIKVNQIRLINQDNAGVSVARNIGIKESRGIYIGFVDADDLLMPDYIATLLESISDAQGNSPDIVEFGYKTFKQNYAEAALDKARYSNELFGWRGCNSILNHVHAKASWYPWTRIFKRPLFNNKYFPPSVRFCEDLMIIPALYEDASTILVLKNTLYAYRFAGASATFNIRPDYFENLFQFYQTIPRHKGLRFDYLRFAVANAIYSCNMKSAFKYPIPELITLDLKRLRLNPRIYFELDFRRVLNVCYNQLIIKIKQLIKHESNF